LLALYQTNEFGMIRRKQLSYFIPAGDWLIKSC